MKIGIDISQIVHVGTGVGEYMRQLVRMLITHAPSHTFVLFGASLRKQKVFAAFCSDLPERIKSRIRLVSVPLPPTLLDILWNVLHIVPVEIFTGPVDVFWSSDWTQPPLRHAIGITTIHDLAFFRYPASFHKTIRMVQKRRLRHAVRENRAILCDSEATKRDIMDFINIDSSRLHVVYPGFYQSTGATI